MSSPGALALTRTHRLDPHPASDHEFSHSSLDRTLGGHLMRGRHRGHPDIALLVVTSRSTSDCSMSGIPADRAGVWGSWRGPWELGLSGVHGLHAQGRTWGWEPRVCVLPGGCPSLAQALTLF